jgi:7,8-dihydroneopterin aldolase/epimerase/oxygenase
MKTTVSIRDAQFFSYHGFYEEERLSGHHFVVDVSVILKNFDSLDDNIADTVNYESIYNICKQEMETSQKLIETVALQIINRCKNELNNVDTVKVKIEKIGPQLGGKVGKSVIEMEN